MAFIVTTVIDGKEYDVQHVSSAAELKDNSFVKFDRHVRLEETAGDVFVGGTNGPVTGGSHQEARDVFENYAFNILAVPTSDKIELDAYSAYTIRQRDEYGVKFQMVCPFIYNQDYNHEGIIQVGTEVLDEGVEDPKVPLVYWVAGAEAGCQIQNSVMAMTYDGSFKPDSNLTRAEMKKMIDDGIFVFHNVDRVPTVLKDINSLVKISVSDADKKSEDFKENQTIRVLDGRCVQIANIFNTTYLGKYGNTEANRSLLKNDIVDAAIELANIQAIQPYNEESATIAMGNTIRDVVMSEELQPVNAMERLFFTITLV